MEHQDYLYLFQTCAAIAALIAVFVVFKYETIDKYVDNRKEALRVILKIQEFPERALWIQNIGKSDNKQESYDQKLLDLGVPSVDVFISNIKYYRNERRQILSQGKRDMLLWVVAAAMYLVAHIFDFYDRHWLQVLLLLFFIPATHSILFVKSRVS